MKLIMVFYYSKANKYGKYQMAVKMINTETMNSAYYQIDSGTLDYWVHDYLKYKQFYIENRCDLSNIPIRQFNAEFKGDDFLNNKSDFEKALKELGVIE